MVQMKRIKTVLRWMGGLFVLIVLMGPLVGQQQKAEEAATVKEYAEVVNAEVIVRALKKGEPVGGLQQADFSLFEEDRQQEITSFVEVRRKIGAADGAVETTEGTKEPGKRRLFLLYFWVSGPKFPYQEALDYFFGQVYRPGDYVLLVIGDRVFKITRQEHIARVMPVFKEKLAEVLKWTTVERERAIREAGELFKVFALAFKQNERRGLEQARLINDFDMRYRLIWEEYKSRRLTSNVDHLVKLAGSLTTVELEKWGLVFYQPDAFPLFDPESLMVDKESSLKDLNRVKEVVGAFTRQMRRPPTAVAGLKEVEQAFIRANATFHLMLSESDAPQQYETTYLKMEYVHSDWQGAFDSISRASGGDVRTGRKFDDLLVQAVDREDIYYRLTYAPAKDKGESRKLTIECRDREVKLRYNRRLLLAGDDGIRIDGLSVSPPEVTFALNRYRQLYDGSRLFGDIEVKVTAVAETGKLNNYTQTFEPDQESLTVAMKMNFPTAGPYTLIVEAVDRQSGKSTIASRKVTVPREVSKPTAAEPVAVERGEGLPQILARAARYCERLKRATFFFTCVEEVRDSAFLGKKKSYENVYMYDYQIVRDKKGKMTERRIANTTDRQGNPLRPEWTFTNFFSNYSYLMPVALLGKENRPKYRYGIVAEEKINDCLTVKIEIEPKASYDRTINHGLVWVDASDGSVVKIELNPRSIEGLDELLKKAKEKNADLELTDIHWYEAKRKGIRFPSCTQMSRVYLAKPAEAGQPRLILESARTVFSFRDYLFFRVNVDVQHQ
jgi:hypothetical protein